jgi:hypothetical protein
VSVTRFQELYVNIGRQKCSGVREKSGWWAGRVCVSAYAQHPPSELLPLCFSFSIFTTSEPFGASAVSESWFSKIFETKCREASSMPMLSLAEVANLHMHRDVR